jgi:hypothetical protein
MTPKELIQKLSELPPDLPIWLGVDSGEGYLPLEEVFVGNTVALDWDLDCASSQELEYFDEDAPLALEPGWIADGDCIHKEVIILGERHTETRYKSSLKMFFERDAIEAQQRKDKIAALEKQLELLRRGS